MNKKDIADYLKYCNFKQGTPVICTTTNKIFSTTTEGAEFYNCIATNIHKCCRGKHQTCGKLSDGTKLNWMYLKDYTKQKKLNNEEIANLFMAKLMASRSKNCN